jgi:hypothetical protein
MDGQVDSNGVPVVVPNDMVSHSNSFEFTQSQQSVEGIGASRLAADDLSRITISLCLLSISLYHMQKK